MALPTEQLGSLEALVFMLEHYPARESEDEEEKEERERLFFSRSVEALKVPPILGSGVS